LSPDKVGNLPVPKALQEDRLLHVEKVDKMPKWDMVNRQLYDEYQNRLWDDHDDDNLVPITAEMIKEAKEMERKNSQQ